MKGNPLNHPVTDYILFSLLALIWSSSFLFIKIAVADIPPMSITAIRLLIAAVLLYAWLRHQNLRLSVDKADWAKFVFIGAVGNALPFFLISFGEVSVDSGMAAILMGIMPIATVLLAHLVIPEEPFTRLKSLGVAIGFAGVITLVGWDALGGLAETTFAQLAILGAALCYAINAVFIRRMTTLTGTVMATGSIICGCLIILPFALWLEQPWHIQASTASIVSVVILGVFPTAIATLILFRLIANLGASTLSQVNYVIPILGAIWGIIFLGEALHTSAIIALMMVLVGLAIVNHSRSETG